MMIRVKQLTPGAKRPTKAHEYDAGFDLCSVKGGALLPGERCVVGTGYAWAIPRGYVGFVVPRSGWAMKNGITVTNSPGSVDCGYRGEVCVILHNHGTHTFRWNIGERIAQLVVTRIHDCNEVEVVDELDATVRGDGGFGSTGK